MYQVRVWGKASQKNILSKFISAEELNDNALQWLRSNHIPIASSCNGDGVCKKCIINNDQLSCKTQLSDFLNLQGQINIEVSYL